jgi:hypothetical protein
MTHEEIVKALNYLAPKKEWTLSGDNYADLVWLSEGTPPTLAEVEAEIALIPVRKEQIKTDKENARIAAEAKLAGLGLTIDDLKALGLN